MDMTLFSEIRPTWEVLPFGEEKDILPTCTSREKPAICPMMIGNKLVYRKFMHHKGLPDTSSNLKEISRYVFCSGGVIEEDEGESWKFTSAQKIAEDTDYYECFPDMTLGKKDELAQDFAKKAVVKNKSNILLAMNIFGDDEIFRLCDFLAVYSRAGEEENGIEDTPWRIVNDLCGRKLATGKAVRIAKDLVAVTIDRNIKDTKYKEETRAYFDGHGAYYFRKSILTGRWQKESPQDFLNDHDDLSKKYFDKDIFENTCMERFISKSVVREFKGERKVSFGKMLAQATFLSAEQASKVDDNLYKLVLSNIFGGQITNGRLSLSELLGVTGSQIKFLKGVILPYELKNFAACMKDPEFIQHFPDVKKRIFATSLYLIGRDSWFINLDITRDELFEAAQTVNSMEKLDTEKRNRLTGEYLDYIKMRRTYVKYVDGMTDDDPLSEEIKRCGDFPINLKPSIIKDRHDKIGRIVELIGCASQIERYDARISNIKKKESSDWEYRTGKYSIIMPENARDIINEGRQLNHCVGRAGYIEKMAEGNCRILFLRNNQDIHKPLITMEEVDGAIRQCYGYGDSINTDLEIRDFIKEYAGVKNLTISARIYRE